MPKSLYVLILAIGIWQLALLVGRKLGLKENGNVFD